jgi:glycosyltransferase involved in cell wall biosynthesis/SAM-dependent methyltransferase
MEKPLISIACVAYNHEKYIAQAVEGFLMQEINFLVEIIIHDDASTDNTAKIVAEFAQKYPALIYPIFQAVNQYSQKRKPFIDFIFPKCRGKYIAVCEGDDYWTDPNKLQKQIDFLESNPEYVICFHNAQVMFDDPREKIMLYSDFPWNGIDRKRDVYTIEDLIATPLCPTASVIFRKPANFNLPDWFYKVPSGDMALQTLLCGDGKVKYFDECWAVYRKHSAGITAYHRGDWINAGRIYMYLRINEYYQGRYVDPIKKVIKSHLSQLKSTDLISEEDKKIISSMFSESNCSKKNNPNMEKINCLHTNDRKDKNECFLGMTSLQKQQYFGKVTFVAYGPNHINGPNVWLQRILPELAKLGVQPRVLFLMSSDNPCDIVKNLEQHDIKCTTIQRQKYTEQNILQVLETLQSDPPDIFVPNLSVPAYFASRWVKEAGIPTVGILHSDDNFHHELIEYFVDGMPEYRLSGIVCVSKFIEEQVKSVNNENIEVLRCPYGINLPQNLIEEPEGRLSLVYTGRLIQRQKRIFDVITALKDAVTSIPNTYASIYGEDREGGKVIETINSLNLGERLKYGGLLKVDEIFPTLLKHHAFVLLSDYEGMSISLMEAMGSGLVPICTKTRSGMMEIIRHDENGLLVNNRGADFINAVKRLRYEKGLWSRLSKAARETIEREYTIKMCAARWAGFLTNLAEQSQAKGTIRIPNINTINLPPVKVSDNGICREDKRIPNTAVTNSANNFLNPQCTKENMDLYLVRSSILRALKEFLPQCKGVFLDVGCGEMPYKQLILQYAEKYIGLDIRNPVYQKAVKPDIFWDGKHIPLDDNSIDCAMATELFEHLPDIETVLKEIRRVLKSGGSLFFTMPFLWPLHDMPHDEYRYTPVSLQRHLRNAGFDDIRIASLGGWDASLAQMIGLWMKRRPMSTDKRNEFIELLFPFYRELIDTEMKYEPLTYDDMLKKNVMVTGLYGIAGEKNLKNMQVSYEPSAFEKEQKESMTMTLNKVVIVQGGFPVISATFILDQITGFINRGFCIENWATYNPHQQSVHHEVQKYDLLKKTKYIQIPNKTAKTDIDAWTNEFLHINNIGSLKSISAFHVHYGANFNLIEPLFRKYQGFVLVSFHGYDASRYFKQHGDSCYTYLFRRANLITTPSFIMKNELVKRGCQAEKVIVHRYGVDISKFACDRENKSKDAKVVLLTAGRFVEKKGIEYSIKAFARLRNQANTEYRIIGDGDLRPVFESLIKELDLGGKVKLLGWRNKEEVLTELKNADIFVLTSVVASDGDSEGLPVSLIEAQACGLPVISTFHAGIPELVENGVTGFLVEEKDVEAIADKMALLIENRQLRDSFSEKAVIRVRNEFDIEKLNDKLADYFKVVKGEDSERKENNVLLEALTRVGWSNKYELYREFFDSIDIWKNISEPAISIIVISWRLHPDTMKNFQILERQRDKKFELIFIDNGGKEGEFDSLKPYIDIYVRLNKNSGAYLARNIGALFAKAPILFFLEDDGLPEGNIVEAHLNVHATYDVIAVRGVYRQKTDNPINRMAEHYFLGDKPYPYPGNLEGNASYRADVFYKVGGWDDDIIFGHGGIDLAIRLLAVEPDKRKQIYSPLPVIYHDFAVDTEHLTSKLKKQNESLLRLRKKHSQCGATLNSWRRLNRRYDLLIVKKQSCNVEPENQTAQQNLINAEMNCISNKGEGKMGPMQFAKPEYGLRLFKDVLFFYEEGNMDKAEELIDGYVKETLELQK